MEYTAQDFFLVKESPPLKFAILGIGRSAVGIGEKSRKFFFGRLRRQVVQNRPKPLLNCFLGSFLSFKSVSDIF